MTFMDSASKLNYYWSRVLFEAMALKVECHEKLESSVDQLISVYLESQLQMDARITDDHYDGDNEKFNEDQKTQRQEELDYFSKLMKNKIDFSL